MPVNLESYDAFIKQAMADGRLTIDGEWQLTAFAENGDIRLKHLKFHPSIAAAHLWYMLMSEEDRLHAARKAGKFIVGAMKDLGTLPVLMNAFSNTVTFYPDGAWWLPCFKQRNERLLDIAAEYGMGDGMCPVRSMIGAFVNQKHFPIPDLLFSSVGAVCDDFSAVVQRIHEKIHPVHFWEVPQVRPPAPGEPYYQTETGYKIPRIFMEAVRAELRLIVQKMEDATHEKLTDEKLADSIHQANEIRCMIRTLREKVYTANFPPIPALEMMVMEMFALHYCSDRNACRTMLQLMLKEVEAFVPPDRPTSRVPIYWVNPTADLQAMNLLEDCGARLAGADFMFLHALDALDETVPPLNALAIAALSDPMAGSLEYRAQRILAEMKQFGARGCVVSRIPGASHCAYEGRFIKKYLAEHAGIPVVEVEIDSVCEGGAAAARTRIEAMVERLQFDE